MKETKNDKIIFFLNLIYERNEKRQNYFPKKKFNLRMKRMTTKLFLIKNLIQERNQK